MVSEVYEMAAKKSSMTQSERGRGRPVSFDREAAVSIALNAFWESGYRAVSISNLSQAMQIKRSSFYNSFGDRKSIFKEAMEIYKADAPDAALWNLKEGDLIVPAVRSVFRNICRVRAADKKARGCLVVNSISELAGGDEELGVLCQAAVRDGTRLYVKLLSQAVEQGEITLPENITAAAGSFMAFVAGLNTLSKAIRSEQDLWQICDLFLIQQGFDE
jgi:TetR/AcrR family transcriptional regulator, transcriptional repressor for nem operon